MAGEQSDVAQPEWPQAIGCPRGAWHHPRNVRHAAGPTDGVVILTGAHVFARNRAGKKGIAMIWPHELPDLEETQSGKDLIRIGEQRGLAKAVRFLLTTRHGRIPAAMAKKIRTLPRAKARRLIHYLPQCQTLADVARWLAGRHA